MNDIEVLEELRKELGLFANGNKIKQGQALEHLIKAYKELEEENKRLNNANKTYINCIQNITPVLTADYIEKSLIKEKIEELKNEYKIALEENSTKAFILKCQITILQELLEKGEIEWEN